MRIIKLFLALAFALTLPTLAHAGTANFYSTTAASGTENSAVIPLANIGLSYGQPAPVMLIAACNYNASAPEIVMVFDAAALPANGVVPKLELPLSAATGSAAPTCGSLALPSDGVSFYKGVVVASSTSGKTLTIDTTSGGNTFFQVGY